VISGFNSFAIPPLVPVSPPGEAVRVELYKIAVYFGGFIPDELLDSVIGGEWDDAIKVSFMIGSYKVVAYLKHDGQYLYIALEIATGKEFRGYSEGYIWFDNGDGQEFGAGDDIIIVEGGQGVLFEADFCYVGKYDFRFDPAEGGTNNAWGIGAYDIKKSSYVFEFIKELDSGDPLDVYLGPGSETEVIFGFVGEASPAGEFMSALHQIELVTEMVTLAALGVITQKVKELRNNLIRNKLIPGAPTPSIRPDVSSFYDSATGVLHIKPGSTKGVISHEYMHLILRMAIGKDAYEKYFGHGEDHSMLNEYPGATAKSEAGATEEGLVTGLATMASTNKSPIWKDGKQEADLENNTLVFKERRVHPGTKKEETVTVTQFVLGKNVYFRYDASYSDGTMQTTYSDWLEAAKVEFCIACALRDFLDGPANGVADKDNDGLSIPLSTILTAISIRTPKNFRELAEELRKGLSAGEKKAFDKILENHGLK